MVESMISTSLARLERELAGIGAGRAASTSMASAGFGERTSAFAPTGGHLAEVLDEVDTGVVVCDANGQVQLANEAARRELASGGVLQLDGEGGLAVDGSGGALLQRAMHNAALNGLRQLVPLGTGSRRLMVAVQPLRGASGSAAGSVLLLGRRKLCPDLAVQMLGRLVDLTAAEQSVLSSLLAGERVTALAKSRGVAVSTVRTQVAALRSKFGVRRIEDITRLVAELPPMMGALRSPLPTQATPPLHRSPMPQGSVTPSMAHMTRPGDAARLALHG